MADRIQERRDTKLRWEQINPILLEGERGYCTDEPNLHKLGDGIHAWNDLPWQGYNGNVTNSLGNDENAVVSEALTSKLATEINVSILYPTGGIDDSNLYDINTAITKLPDSAKRKGIKVSFLNKDNDYEVWQFIGKDITKVSDWEQVGQPVRAHIISSDQYAFAITDSDNNLLFAIDRSGAIIASRGMSDETRENFRKLNKWQEKQDDRLLSIEQGLWPLSVECKLNRAALPVNETSTLQLSVKAIRKGEDVTSKADIRLNGERVTDGYTFDVTPNEVGDTRYSVSVDYEDLTVTESITIPVTYPSYFGITENNADIDMIDINNLTKLILPTRSYKTNVSLNHQKAVYMYPASKGALTTIKDENGYELINSYTRKDTTLFDNIPYYIYILTNPITITNGIQNYD